MNEHDVVFWSKDYKLTWSDFNAESNPAVFEDSHSFIKYRCTWTVESENFGSEIKFHILDIVLIPEFHKHLSWVRMPMASVELLKHEQGHFDLAELLRLEFTQQIKNLFENKWFPTRGQNEEQRKQFAREDSGVMIAKEIEKLESLLLTKRQDYDTQTNFGQIQKIQDEFNATFALLHK